MLQPVGQYGFVFNVDNAEKPVDDEHPVVKRRRIESKSNVIAFALVDPRANYERQSAEVSRHGTITTDIRNVTSRYAYFVAGATVTNCEDSLGHATVAVSGPAWIVNNSDEELFALDRVVAHAVVLPPKKGAPPRDDIMGGPTAAVRGHIACEQPSFDKRDVVYPVGIVLSTGRKSERTDVLLHRPSPRMLWEIEKHIVNAEAESMEDIFKRFGGRYARYFDRGLEMKKAMESMPKREEAATKSHRIDAVLAALTRTTTADPAKVAVFTGEVRVARAKVGLAVATHRRGAYKAYKTLKDLFDTTLVYRNLDEMTRIARTLENMPKEELLSSHDLTEARVAVEMLVNAPARFARETADFQRGVMALEKDVDVVERYLADEIAYMDEVATRIENYMSGTGSNGSGDGGHTGRDPPPALPVSTPAPSYPPHPPPEAIPIGPPSSTPPPIPVPAPPTVDSATLLRDYAAKRAAWAKAVVKEARTIVQDAGARVKSMHELAVTAGAFGGRDTPGNFDLLREAQSLAATASLREQHISTVLKSLAMRDGHGRTNVEYLKTECSGLVTDIYRLCDEQNTRVGQLTAELTFADDGAKHMMEELREAEDVSARLLGITEAHYDIGTLVSVSTDLNARVNKIRFGMTGVDTLLARARDLYGKSGPAISEINTKCRRATDLANQAIELQAKSRTIFGEAGTATPDPSDRPNGDAGDGHRPAGAAENAGTAPAPAPEPMKTPAPAPAATPAPAPAPAPELVKTPAAAVPVGDSSQPPPAGSGGAPGDATSPVPVPEPSSHPLQPQVPAARDKAASVIAELEDLIARANEYAETATADADSANHIATGARVIKHRNVGATAAPRANEAVRLVDVAADEVEQMRSKIPAGSASAAAASDDAAWFQEKKLQIRQLQRSVASWVNSVSGKAIASRKMSAKVAHGAQTLARRYAAVKPTLDAAANSDEALNVKTLEECDSIAAALRDIGPHAVSVRKMADEIAQLCQDIEIGLEGANDILAMATSRKSAIVGRIEEEERLRMSAAAQAPIQPSQGSGAADPSPSSSSSQPQQPPVPSVDPAEEPSVASGPADAKSRPLSRASTTMSSPSGSQQQLRSASPPAISAVPPVVSASVPTTPQAAAAAVPLLAPTAGPVRSSAMAFIKTAIRGAAEAVGWPAPSQAETLSNGIFGKIVLLLLRLSTNDSGEAVTAAPIVGIVNALYDKTENQAELLRPHLDRLIKLCSDMQMDSSGLPDGKVTLVARSILALRSVDQKHMQKILSCILNNLSIDAYIKGDSFSEDILKAKDGPPWTATVLTDYMVNEVRGEARTSMAATGMATGGTAAPAQAQSKPAANVGNGPSPLVVTVARQPKPATPAAQLVDDARDRKAVQFAGVVAPIIETVWNVPPPSLPADIAEKITPLVSTITAADPGAIASAATDFFADIAKILGVDFNVVGVPSKKMSQLARGVYHFVVIDIPQEDKQAFVQSVLVSPRGAGFNYEIGVNKCTNRTDPSYRLLLSPVDITRLISDAMEGLPVDNTPKPRKKGKK